MAMVTVAAIVFVERAQRRLLIQYPKRQVRQQDVPGRYFASAAEAEHLGRHPADLRLVAAAAADHHRRRSPARATGPSGSNDRRRLALGRGQPLYLAVYAVLIVFFAFFYTSIVFNPDGDGG